MQASNSKHSMVIRADAKAMGVVTSTTTRVSPRWTPSKHKASECVSIMPDGTTKIFAPTRASNRNIAGVTRRTTRVSYASEYFHRIAQLGSIAQYD